MTAGWKLIQATIMCLASGKKLMSNGASWAMQSGKRSKRKRSKNARKPWNAGMKPMWSSSAELPSFKTKKIRNRASIESDKLRATYQTIKDMLGHAYFRTGSQLSKFEVAVRPELVTVHMSRDEVQNKLSDIF